jgi:hypothetical protein
MGWSSSSDEESVEVARSVIKRSKGVDERHKTVPT